MHRMISEKAIEQSLPWHFETGDSWHCISHGDVDIFSYIKAVLKQEKIDYLLLSTWCAAYEDFKEIENLIDRGIIKKVDFYVGEIFPKSYAKVFDLGKKIVDKCNGRICVFRNHSKVSVLKGEKSFVIESSANVNTNPRVEQTTITLNDELAEFYIDFYKSIRSFN